MVCCIKRAVALPGLALALLMGPQAFAASEDEKPEIQQSQPSEDSKSYLPPWMQNPAGTAGLSANPAGKSAEAPGLEVTGDLAAKQKQAGQKTPRRRRDSGFFFFWR